LDVPEIERLGEDVGRAASCDHAEPRLYGEGFFH
jgi:hypothetical protein